MNKFVEAIRRLLLIITWLPTTIFVGYILLNFNEVADAFYDDIPIFAGFIIVPLVVHYVINWIFQVNESGNNRNQQRDAESNGTDINTKYNDPVDKIFVLILAWGWFGGCVYYGYTVNNIPFFDFSFWGSFETIVARIKETGGYLLLGAIGFVLIQFVAEKIYKRK
jgi:hypothetical protein